MWEWGKEVSYKDSSPSSTHLIKIGPETDGVLPDTVGLSLLLRVAEEGPEGGGAAVIREEDWQPNDMF